MNDQTQHILGAADSAHQGVELARSLLQEGLGNMGEILTQGCESLGTASLGSTMRLGQKLKEFSFLLDDLLKDAHGLCILLGKDLGVCEDEVRVLFPGPESPSNTERYRFDMFGDNLSDMVGEPLGTPDYRDLLFAPNSEDLEPGKDEFDDDEQPF